MPAFLLPEGVFREDGESAAIDLKQSQSKPLVLTLGITRILEQESLDVSIWGSPDGETWQPLAAFPQKFYCGTYPLFLDFSRRKDTRYLKAQWRMIRWSGGPEKPLFEFFLYAEDAKVAVVGAA